MLFESIDWRRFSQPMKGLSARSWARLALAFLYESGGDEYISAGEPAELTRRLAALGRAVREDALALAAWGEDYYGHENTLTVHIRRLREKIEPDPSAPRHIITARGLGYRLEGAHE